MRKDREVEVVDSREADVDHIEKVVDLKILHKKKENMSEKVMRKTRLSGKVVIPTEEVLVLTEEDVILILDVIFMVIISDVTKKGIDPLSIVTFVKMDKVT